MLKQNLFLLSNKKLQLKNTAKGLTLFELAIAIAIFVLAASGIFSLLIACSTITESSGNISRMINIAREELENNVMTANFVNLATYAVLPPDIPADTSLACYIQNHPTILGVKQATIVVCYKEKPDRVIGEDQNLNGALDGGEDLNGDGRLSSPCEIATFIMRTE